VRKINIILLLIMFAGAGCQHTRNGGVPTEAQLRKQEAIALKVSQRAFKQILDALNTYKSKMHPNDLKNSRDVVKVVNENLKIWEAKVIKGEPALGIDKLIDTNLSLLAEILTRQQKIKE
jgi:hypothetical protein